MFLTRSELIELTGYKRRQDQITQLREMGLHPYINRLGEPKITWAMVDGQERKRTEPRFDRLK